MADAALLTLLVVLNVGLPVAVIRWDLGRLSPRRRARAWSDATILAAPLLCGPLCLPVYFAKTRWSVAGFGLGLGWMVAVLGVLAAMQLGLGWLFASLGWSGATAGGG